MTYDVVIVGAGPTGMSAALLLGRCRRTVLVVDSGQPRNATSKGIHGFVTRDGISPFEFKDIAREQAERYPTVSFCDGEAVDAQVVKSGFEVVLRQGEKIRCRRLLLATGLVDDLPEIEGIGRFWGKSVFVCPICDGWEVCDEPLLVYGSGPALPSFALELLIWSRDLAIATPGPCGFSERERAHFSRQGIRLIEEKIVRLEGEGSRLQRVVFASGEVLERSAIFLSTAQHQRSELPEKLGCRFTGEGAVAGRELERTNVPGLYVAGNASKGLQLAIIAAAEGAKAAYSINESLQAEETGFEPPEDLS